MNLFATENTEDTGTVIDAAQPDADERLHALEAELARGILNLNVKLEADTALRERVRSRLKPDTLRAATPAVRTCAIGMTRATGQIYRSYIGTSDTLGSFTDLRKVANPEKAEVAARWVGKSESLP